MCKTYQEIFFAASTNIILAHLWYSKHFNWPVVWVLWWYGRRRNLFKTQIITNAKSYHKSLNYEELHNRAKIYSKEKKSNKELQFELPNKARLMEIRENYGSDRENHMCYSRLGWQDDLTDQGSQRYEV